MPFQPLILCGRQSYKKNYEKGYRQSRVKREGSDDLPCSGGSRPVLMGGPGWAGGQGPIVMMSEGEGGGAIVMSNGGEGGGLHVILLLMQTPRSGGPQGGPDSQLRGHWPPLAPPRTATASMLSANTHTQKNISVRHQHESSQLET